MLEQLKLLDAAGSAKVSPGALDFYQEHANVGDARLAGLPLDQALRVSTLAEQSGQGGFILDYLTKYKSDPDAVSALADASPEALNLYAKQVSVPNSLLQQVAPEKGMQLTDGKVVSVDPNLASALARQLSADTGKDAWGSAATGQVYLPVSSARAWTAGEQLIDILRRSPNEINGSNAQALMQVIGKESVRGSGNGFEMGPFTPNSAVNLPPELTGVERGIYIQNALNKGVKFYDMGDVYYALKDAGFSDQQLWPINEAALQSAMESKAPIDFVYTDIDASLKQNEYESDADVPIRVREMRWVIAHADQYGYVREGNSWVLNPNP